jgi:hypothetical protein
MTDKQRAAKLDRAVRQLMQTLEGYKTAPNGPRWKAAMALLDELATDLKRPPIPQLGPLVKDGLATNLVSPTHVTSGVDWPAGKPYPAFDAGFLAGGRPVLAVEALKVTRDSSAQGGDAFYATGASGIRYWYGHLDSAPAVGRTFRKGETVARVKFGPGQPPGGPHAHLGLDVTPLGLPPLKWGRDGNGPPYTFGAPTIGAQLAKGLA